MNVMDVKLYNNMDFNSTLQAVDKHYCLVLFVIDLPQAS